MSLSVLPETAVAGVIVDWKALLVLLFFIGGTILAPKGRRLLIAFPVVITVVAVIALVADGRSEATREAAEGRAAAKATATKTYEASCKLAKSSADLGLVDASRHQLERAEAAKPDDATSTAVATCAMAAKTLKASSPPAATRVDVMSNTAAATTPTTSIDVFAAAEKGTHHLLRPVLADRNKDGTDLEIGTYGWLLIAGLLLGILVSWTSLYFWFVRLLTTPSVKLMEPIAGSDDVKGVAGMGAELRARLFADDLRSPVVPNSSLPDDLAGVIAESGVGGAKFISSLVTATRKLFKVSNSVTARVTVLDTPPTRAVVEVVDDHSGATIALETVTASPGELLLPIVAVIKARALSRLGNPQLPPWLEWPAPALEEYLAGVRAEDLTTAASPEGVS